MGKSRGKKEKKILIEQDKKYLDKEQDIHKILKYLTRFRPMYIPVRKCNVCNNRYKINEFPIYKLRTLQGLKVTYNDIKICKACTGTLWEPLKSIEIIF